MECRAERERKRERERRGWFERIKKGSRPFYSSSIPRRKRAVYRDIIDKKHFPSRNPYHDPSLFLSLSLSFSLPLPLYLPIRFPCFRRFVGIHDHAASKVINVVEVELTTRKQFVRSSNRLAGCLYGCPFARPARFLLLFSLLRVQHTACSMLLLRSRMRHGQWIGFSFDNRRHNPRVSPVNGNHREWAHS